MQSVAKTRSWSVVGVLVIAAVTLALAGRRLGITQVSPDGRAAGPDAVFLIVVDTLRADRLSCYGYKRHATENIDRLARRGVVFTNAQSVASWTRPSMGAIMTSRYPSELGLVETASDPDKQFEWREKRPQVGVTIPRAAPTLAEAFQSGGFHTAAFVNQPALNIWKNGFQRGFDEWFYPTSKGTIDQMHPQNGIEQQKWATNNFADQYDADLAAEFEGWISKRNDGPLFVWIHLLNPHAPYTPHKRNGPFVPHKELGKPMASALYDGEIRSTDVVIGRIVDAIEDHVGWDRAAAVFVSDHGEEFGERDMFGHGHTLHREVLNVPLIIAAPGFPAGRIIEQYVRTIDIFPTLADLARLPDDLSESTAGQNILPWIAGESEDLPVYAEAMLYGSTERALILHDKKLIYDQFGDQYQLFDTKGDPAELVDLGSGQKDRLARMKRDLHGLYYRLSENLVSLAREDGQSGAERIRQRELAVDALRSLGYLSGGDGDADDGDEDD
jgi:arylsulfatase A-like enzyme